MDELLCDQCGRHLAWICYAGPRGIIYCDDCHEEHEEDEASDSDA